MAGGCSFFRNETRQMVFTDLTFRVAPWLSCQHRERWFCVCHSLRPLRSCRRGGMDKVLLGRCECRARTASAENTPRNKASRSSLLLQAQNAQRTDPRASSPLRGSSSPCSTGRAVLVQWYHTKLQSKQSPGDEQDCCKHGMCYQAGSAC